MGDLVERLRKGSKNVELARQYGVAGYLAGWEHQTMAEAAALIERQAVEIDALKHDIGRARETGNEMAALIEEVREAFQAIVDGDMPRPLGQIYRQDKKRSKHDLCIHRVPMHDDCGNCTAAFVLATLAKLDGANTDIKEA